MENGTTGGFFIYEKSNIQVSPKSFVLDHFYYVPQAHLSL